MTERYLHILNFMLECPKENKVDAYMQLLLTPLNIKKSSSGQYLSKLEHYRETAKKYSENQSEENKAEMERIIAELKKLGEV